MKCPNCDLNLVMSDRNGVEIDYCPQCRGVWLDRGELDKIVERSAMPPQASDSRRDHQSNHGNSDYQGRKKKDSFLGDLFDF